MQHNRIIVLALALLCVGTLALALDQTVPLQNWTASPYWTPPAAAQARQHLTGAKASPEVTAAPVPTTILPFTAVTPCRLYDSRASDPPFTGDSTFNTDGQTELIDFYATTTTPYAANGNPNGCTLPTAGTVGAWSLKFTYRTSSATQGYLTAYPGFTTRPGIGTILGDADQQTSGAAIVPAGADADNTINVYAQYAANTIVIDYNGYFAAQPVVTGITDGVIATPLTGVVGFTGGPGITVDASSGTVTITGPGGPTGPTGPIGPTGLPGTPADWRAGTATIAAAASSVTVTMSSAFTGSPTDYRVAAAFTQAVNWGADSAHVPIVVITNKTATTFQIHTYSRAGAALVAPAGGVTIDWIAMPSQ